MEDGSCPSCSQSFDRSEQVETSLVTESTTANPYDLTSPSDPFYFKSVAPIAKEPFSHQAAKFSAYAPFIMLLMGITVQGAVEQEQRVESGILLALILGGMSFLTIIAAFVLGGVGLLGGIQRRAARTILLSIAGIVLNGSAIGCTFLAFLFAVLGPSPHRTTAWDTLASSSPPFTIQMPAYPTMSSQSYDSPDGEVTAMSYEAYDGLANFNIVSMQYPAGALTQQTPSDVMAALDATLDQAITARSGYLLSRQDVLWDGYRGREQRLRFESGPESPSDAPTLVMESWRVFAWEDSILMLTVIFEREDYNENRPEIEDRLERFFGSLDFK